MATRLPETATAALKLLLARTSGALSLDTKRPHEDIGHARPRRAVAQPGSAYHHGIARDGRRITELLAPGPIGGAQPGFLPPSAADPRKDIGRSRGADRDPATRG